MPTNAQTPPRASVMPFVERRAWLLRTIAKERRVDVLNAELVEDYAEVTGAKLARSMWGAGWCPLLAKDLRELFKRRLLNRTAVGLNGGAWQPGFPKWVYSYRLSGIGRDAVASLSDAAADPSEQRS